MTDPTPTAGSAGDQGEAAYVPKGTGIIEHIGWGDESRARFEALIVFPNGPATGVRLGTVWQQKPVVIVEHAEIADLRTRLAASEARAQAAEADRDNLAELVGQYAEAEQPEALTILGKDRDRWFERAQTAEARLRTIEALIEPMREVLTEAHDALHNCTAVLTMNDSASVAPVMARIRALAALPTTDKDASHG